MNGGLLPDSVRERLKPLAEAVISGTFSSTEDTHISVAKKYCSMVLEGKAAVSCYSQTNMLDGRISIDLTIISPYQ